MAMHHVEGDAEISDVDSASAQAGLPVRHILIYGLLIVLLGLGVAGLATLSSLIP